ncbi:hypothetical protein ACJRO7_034431 [Eucalyptus globulus]|uniref:Cytochrome P450 n=1 Tax=Eucalyptus globulus TaxID=34317 RepID=A0ABD3J695_EUCGL
MGAVLGWILGLIPLLGWLLWWWNEIWYLPPGQMGFPFFGEIFTFLWHFKNFCHSDEFINSKRRKYDPPCFPSISKFIFRDEDAFLPEWPNVDLVGTNSIVAVHGKAHARLRSFVLNAVNRPDALHGITAFIYQIVLKVSLVFKFVYLLCLQLTFEIIGKLFMSFEPGPQLDEVYWLLHEMVKGIKAQPVNSTKLHITCQVEAIFEVEPEKRKSQSEETVTDLMDGIRQIKDEEGKKLSDQEVLDNIIILEENMSISQNKNGEFITSQDVAEETSRMAYIGAFKFRLSFAMRIPEIYVGYRISKGRKVSLWLQYLHTNPEKIGSAKPEAYQVFGGESRICAGNMLARMQLAILLHHLSVGYKWELVIFNTQ